MLRGKERLEREIELAAKLEPFQHGFLGILPMRTADEKGVTVRYVYPKSPAAAAGIAAGDTLVSLDGKPIRGRLELIEKIGALEPGTTVEIEVRRDDAVRKVKIMLAPLPEELPPKDLPPAIDVRKKAEAAAPPRAGRCQMKTPEYPNEVWGYVPEARRPARRAASWSGCMAPADSIGSNCWPSGSRFATATA